jgi:hypothetical protein
MDPEKTTQSESSEPETTEPETTEPEATEPDSIPVESEEYYNPDAVKEEPQEEPQEVTAEDEHILAELLEKHKQIEEACQKELEDETAAYLQDAENNLNIFKTWMEPNLATPNSYKLFLENFDPEYRSSLFENISEYFNDSELVTDEVLFDFKVLIISILRNHKKFKSYLTDLTLDTSSSSTNLRLIKAKQTFKIFVGDEFLCYFKENGNDYYVS